RGIAVHESFNTVVAQVAEVTVRRDGSWRVDRIMCAVDCGLAVNPDVIRAQMESGIAYGLTAAMHGAITLKDGVVEQSNFHDYMPLRMNEMPRIGVYIARSHHKPPGAGAPATPVIPPAQAHAPAGGKKPETVADRISVYAPDPTLLARAATTAAPDPALSDRLDRLERQLHAERLARAQQQAELAAYTQASQSVYERCVAER